MLTLASYLAENARPTYERIAAYLERRIGEPAVLLTTSLPRDERRRRLEQGEVQIGFLCGWPYVKLADRPEPPVELLCAPVMAAPRYGGRPVYFTDVVVRRDGPLLRFADLRGRSYAYNEPESHSGYNVPADHLGRLGETWSYFGRVVQSGSHQASIRLVEAGETEAAGVDSIVLEVEAARRPELGTALRVVESLGPSPIPPVVVSRALSPACRRRLAEAFLAMHEDPDGRAILRDGLIARFLPTADADYDPVREVGGRVGLRVPA